MVRGCGCCLHPKRAQREQPQDSPSRARLSECSCTAAPWAARGCIDHPGHVPLSRSISHLQSSGGFITDLGYLTCFSYCNLGQAYLWPLYLLLCYIRTPSLVSVPPVGQHGWGTASKPLRPWIICKPCSQATLIPTLSSSQRVQISCICLCMFLTTGRDESVWRDHSSVLSGVQISLIQLLALLQHTPTCNARGGTSDV